MTRRAADGSTPTNGRSKKTLTSIIAGVLVIAAPGAYSAIQELRSNHEQNLKIESATHDKLNSDIQANVAANTVGIEALEKQCVTHKELLEIAFKLQNQRGRRPTATLPLTSHPDIDFEGSVEEEIADLTELLAEEQEFIEDYREIKKRRPKMKAPKDIRNIVRQKASKGDALEF